MLFWCILLDMKKKKHRKQYLKINPLLYAIEGAALIDKESLDGLRFGELAAIEAFRTGSAGIEDWKAMSEIRNLCESMAKDGIGPEALEAIPPVDEALLDAAHRYHTTGKMGTTGPGLKAFRDIYEYHDLQRQAVSRSTYERHIARIVNKIRSKSPDVLFVTRKGES